MSRFNIGDKVIIAIQPTNQWVSLVGEKGYVTGIRADGLIDVDTYADVNSRGVMTGSGSVPPECLRIIE